VNDTLNPSWTAVALSNVSATQLKTQVKLELFDDDVAFDDRVGTCNVPIANGDFDGLLHTFSCPAVAGGVAFKVDYRLKPH
jgi:hypothetical protein